MEAVMKQAYQHPTARVTAPCPVDFAAASVDLPDSPIVPEGSDPAAPDTEWD